MNGHTTSPSPAISAPRKQFMDFAPRKKHSITNNTHSATVSITRSTTVSAQRTSVAASSRTAQASASHHMSVAASPSRSSAPRPMPRPLRPAASRPLSSATSRSDASTTSRPSVTSRSSVSATPHSSSTSASVSASPRKRPIAVHTKPTPHSRPAVSSARRPAVSTPPHPASPSTSRPTTILYPTHSQQHSITTQASYNTTHLKKRDDFLDLDDTFGLLTETDLTEEDTVIVTTQSEASRAAQPEKSSPFKLKSPFVNTKVDKRPLSGDRPDAEHVAALKNAYPTRSLRKKPAVVDNVPTMVKTGASAKSNIGLAIAVLLTVIVGAVVGTIAYLAFFQ